MGKKKDKAVNYNAGRIVIDIVMLFLGLIFIIGTIAGKGDDIAAGFVRIIGAACPDQLLNDQGKDSF